MSQAGKRGPQSLANGPTKPGGGVPGTQFSVSMMNMIRCLDDVRKNTQGFQDYEQLLQEQQRIRQEVEEKDKEIQTLRAQFAENEKQFAEKEKQMQAEIRAKESNGTFLLRQFEARYKEWNEEKSHHSADSVELSRLKVENETLQRQLLSTRDERDKFRDDLQVSQREVDESHRHLESLKRDSKIQGLQLQETSLKLEAERKSLEGCRTTLAQLEDDLGMVKLDPGRTRTFEGLATRFHKLVWNHFDREIAEPLPLFNGQILTHIPQVQSNTKAARAMRCACAEATIADVLSVHIFKDLYLPDTTGTVQLSGLVAAMEGLGKEHALQAAIIRWQLAKVYNNQDSVDRVSEEATRLVIHTLRPWLAGGSRQEDQFALELKQLFSEAAGLWHNIVRTRRVPRVIMELTEDVWFADDIWDEYDEVELIEGQIPPRTTGILGTAPLAVLFPQIDDRWAGDSNEAPLFPGSVLYPTQKAVLAASTERSDQMKLRRASTHRRRPSEHEVRDFQPESQRVSSRRLSTASRDSEGDRASIRSSRKVRADPTASVSSVKSHRSGSTANSR